MAISCATRNCIRLVLAISIRKVQRTREYARFVLAFTIRSFVACNFVRACVKDRLHKILIMTQEKEHKKKLKTEHLHKDSPPGEGRGCLFDKARQGRWEGDEGIKGQAKYTVGTRIAWEECVWRDTNKAVGEALCGRATNQTTLLLGHLANLSSIKLSRDWMN